MSNNGGTYGMCASLLAELGNEYLLGVKNYGDASLIIIQIEK